MLSENDARRLIRSERRLKRLERRVLELEGRLKFQALDPPGEVTIEVDGIKSHFYLPQAVDEHIQKAIFLTGTFYDIKALQALKPRINPGAIIFDVGANIGNHAIYFAHHLQAAHIHCFEAMPETAALLRRNVAMNALEDRITVHETGLGERKGKAEVKQFDLQNQGATALGTTAKGSIEIASLDTLMRNVSPDFIKIDVEGMDFAVLKGAKKILTRDMPQLQVEIKAKNSPDAEEITPWLSSLGYRAEPLSATDTFFSKKT